ncbi:helix-turn-helix domain-containing protein [Pseudomonas aeruginosa]
MKNCASGDEPGESAGDRLREERSRLGFKQEEFAQIGGVNRNTQGSYERGDRSPDANYLTAVAAHGVDVLYVLTGQRTAEPLGDLDTDAHELVQLYQKISEADRAVLMRMAWAFAKSNEVK